MLVRTIETSNLRRIFLFKGRPHRRCLYFGVNKPSSANRSTSERKQEGREGSGKSFLFETRARLKLKICLKSEHGRAEQSIE